MTSSNIFHLFRNLSLIYIFLCFIHILIWRLFHINDLTLIDYFLFYYKLFISSTDILENFIIQFVLEIYK